MRTAWPALLLPSLVAAALAAAPAQAASTLTEYGAGAAGAASGATPGAAATGADGNVWFIDELKPGAIGRMATNGTVTRYTTGLSRDVVFGAMTAGPGGMWFTETSKNKIGRVSASGTITEFSGGSHDKPVGIAAGADGSLWYTAQGKSGAIVRMSPSGATTEFTAGLTANALPQDIVAGPDDALWFTEAASGRIARITVQGQISEFPVALGGGTLGDIAAGPDGNLWFTVRGTNPAIGRISPAGVLATPPLFQLGLPLNSAPQDLVAGADGALYFTDSEAHGVGRVATDGTITMATTAPGAGSSPDDITSGADGALWFTEHGAAQLGRLTVAPAAGAVVASDVTATAATLTADATANGEATDAHVEWDTDSAFSAPTLGPVTPIGAGATAQPVSAQPTGLPKQTTYYARVVATNATGQTVGPVLSFTTTDTGAPSATTLAATAVGSRAATLNAQINPEGHATTYHFAWSTTGGSAQQLPSVDATVGNDVGDHHVEATLGGLRPNVTYTYRVVASGNGLTTEGAERTLRTAAVAPDATTGAAMRTSPDDTLLTGTINPNNSATAYHFEWGATDQFGTATPAPDDLAGGDDADHAVAQALTGLVPNATYHARLVATSLAGTTYGADVSFTTDAVAPVIGDAVAGDVTDSAATVTGAVDPRNSATRCWVEWGTTTGYGRRTADVTLPAALGTRACSQRLEGLAAATTYHARVVAESDGGPARGADTTLRTANPAPGAAPGTPAATPNAGAAVPTYGRTVAAAAARGTVTFRTPDGKLHTLDGSTTVPSGSTFDTTAGELALTTAIDRAGHIQHARFHGARFRLSQPAAQHGMVVIETRERPAGCGARATAASAVSAHAAKKRRKPRSLWGSDDHGRFTTRGRDATATVRGTQWVTTETCAGTRFTVRRGAVSVYDRHTHRRVLIKAGRSYQARIGRAGG